ncbi:DUF4197 domain-containing protein [Parasulfuritortus cantonensis]|uniref:DUF4197 domain-containing protein n=2 Tax=Parasulfuritortus cantonensis TaxID=2528202 RepID=A0A4R1BAI1_9PROT|nr:DUF4197 domain-containing protein [Parasulfuritortus cantonensis]
MAVSGPARADLTDVLKSVLEANTGSSSTATASTPTATSVAATTTLSQTDVVAGLKEALAKGAKDAVASLGKDGGFLNNAGVKIPMPDSMATIDKALRSLGQGKYADQFVVAMNQAAEKAVPEAAGILSDAIRDMTLEDAQAILKGPDDAATQYFRKKSEAKLAERFKPIVSQATDQAGVTYAYKKMVKKAGSWAGLLGAGNEDLDGYVTQKSLDGLFKMVAEEEKNIRANPVARTTDLLKKVFGSLSK